MSIINTIRKIQKSEKELRILFLGLDIAGKTTILKALSYEDMSPFVHFQCEGFNFYVLDVGGYEVNPEIRECKRNFYENADALVFVIDSADQLRLQEGGYELDKLLGEPKLKKVPLLVFANKQDLVQALPTDEISDSLNLNKITDRQWSIVACSAKTQQGLLEGMEWLIKTIQDK